MKATVVGAIFFALGAGAGWLLKPAQHYGSAPVDSFRTKRERQEVVKARDGGRADHERFERILAGLPQRHRFPDNEEKISGIDPAEYPGLLSTLRQRAGATGLSWEDRTVFGNLLRDWYIVEPTAAAIWVRNLGLAEDRFYLGQVIVMAAAGKDYDEGLRLMQEFSVDTKGVLRIPQPLMRKAAEMGTEQLIKLCSLSISRNDSGEGYPIPYPDNFDFRAALDGLAKLEKNGNKVATYPMNLAEEWAMRDPKAAFKWFAQNRKADSVQDLSGYFEDIARKGTPEELGSKVALAAATTHANQRLLVSTCDALLKSSGSAFETLWSELPADIDPSTVGQILLESTARRVGGRIDVFREDLLSGLTPETRVAVVRLVISEKRSNYFWSQPSRDSLSRVLVKLGHTPEETAGLIPKLPVREPTKPLEGYEIRSGILFGEGFLGGDFDSK